MDTAGQGLLDPWVVDLGKLEVEALEPRPLSFAENIHEGWEVKTGMVAHVLV